MLSEAFATQLSRNDMVSSISGSLTPYGSVNLTEMVLEHPFRFLTLLRTSEMFVKPFDHLLRVCEYSGIVRIMPPYILRPLGI